MHGGRHFIVVSVFWGMLLFALGAPGDSGEAPEGKPAAAPEKTVYLTFDDGPSEVTPVILDLLKEHEAAATFFVCGNVTEFGDKVYNRILDEGHALGNHTFSHSYNKVYASADTFEQNVARLDDLIYKFTGARPRLLRFPGGSNNRITKGPDGKSITCELVDRLAKQGYRHFDWNVDSFDYGPNAKDSDAIAKTVVAGVVKRSEAIVLMHDSYPHMATAKALPVIIRELRSQGYAFKALSGESFTVQFLKPSRQAAE
ncbi:MAG TPA: polysaccharide deacetylase family protein [Candidatus Hydrogenedentes bacterium]|nr:polysaccharide deacetylase family protein [Candidatus Hydrogenedentota bacterium]HQE83677.1 polysaccharide deacetylase family protein [Candidatus Hydrogenedentota bacterium]HQH54717.1 polysaccharide deacetylase family protein [Candidatus Hydrogenedentota bacterium]HQM50862.1 polysaccharide deacetylase family protein [Candidatus Hydrogenedentota bacterium]